MIQEELTKALIKLRAQFRRSNLTIAERDQTIVELTDEAVALNQIITDLQAEAAALVAERDSARMMYCEYDNSTQTKEEIAEAHGWGYLYAIPEA
jgi:septal ring factor EnvC (AmiA/AmiB activator)